MVRDGKEWKGMVRGWWVGWWRDDGEMVRERDGDEIVEGTANGEKRCQHLNTII